MTEESATSEALVLTSTVRVFCSTEVVHVGQLGPELKEDHKEDQEGRKGPSTFPWYRRVGGPIQSLVPESGWPHPIPSLLSCPQSDHDWRGDSANGYQQSC